MSSSQQIVPYNNASSAKSLTVELRLWQDRSPQPAALWFQMFSRVWKPDETLALVFDIVLRPEREILKFHRQPSWIFFQRVLGQNFKFLLSLCMGKLDLGMMFDDVFE